MENLAEIGEGEGLSEVVRAHHAILLDFYTPSCVICRRLEPMLAIVASEFADVVAVRKINAEAHPDAAITCMIRGVPSLVLIKEGKLVDRKVGFVSARELRQWLREKLK